MGLTQEQIEQTLGDASTLFPQASKKLAHWNSKLDNQASE
jgi:hypothetical protein